MTLDDEILSEPEAAKYLKCSVMTLYRMRKDGAGPKYFMVRDNIRYRKSDILTYIEKNTRR